jgi:hypothetical protein
MLIKIKVIANAKVSGIVQEADYLKVKVTKPAVDGKANEAVIELLAKHFNTKPSRITIVSGVTNSLKTLRID